MDNKEITKEINSKIRPILKSYGFTKFSGRTYWKYDTDKIDILNFQSLNSYNAEVIGCTTFSFTVNLSTYLNYIPSDTDIKEKGGLLRPMESQGHFRSTVMKTIKQAELSRKDIWFVDNNGQNLSQVISDCKSQIETSAFEWFKQFENKENVLQILLNNESDMEDTFGFGNANSLIRNKFTAHTAVELGLKQIAIDNFEKICDYYKIQYQENKYEYYLDKVKEIKTQINKIKNSTQQAV